MKKIIIIGGGLGGLTAGALLSKQGHQVTLLEQHNVVGGSATTFRRRGGFTVEVGLHEIDNPFDGGEKERIFRTLGVFDHITFIKPDEFFRIKTGKSDFVMPDGIDKAKDALIQKFPKEKSGIEAYFSSITAVAQDIEKLSTIKFWQKMLFPFLFRSVFKYRKSTLKEVLDSIIDDEELKLILSANTPYYHDKADDFSFLYHSIAQYSYYKGGGWYIKGGSQLLSNYLASIINDHGGEVITKANVTEILHRSGKVTGVHYEKKGMRFLLRSDIVISNASPMQTYRMADIPYEMKRSLGISLLTLYLGFSKNLKSVYGKRAYSSFYYRGANSPADYNLTLAKDITNRAAVFVDYSQIDSGLTSPEKSLGAVCTVDYLRDWEGLDEEEYKAKKASVAEAYIKLLELDYPGIGELIEYAEVGTARTVQRYLKTPNGTAYGFAPTASQFFREPEYQSDKLEHLYSVGAWVIGGGFTPAILSGSMVAKAIGNTS